MMSVTSISVGIKSIATNLKFFILRYILFISVHVMINLFFYVVLDLTAENTHEEHTLSTELQPPPLDDKEHHATIYIINLYAVKNNSDNTEEIFENEVIETVPDILGKCKSINNM